MSVKIPSNPISVENFVSGKFVKATGPSIKITSPIMAKLSVR
jgi:hypothetical protein